MRRGLVLLFLSNGTNERVANLLKGGVVGSITEKEKEPSEVDHVQSCTRHLHAWSQWSHYSTSLNRISNFNVCFADPRPSQDSLRGSASQIFLIAWPQRYLLFFSLWFDMCTDGVWMNEGNATQRYQESLCSSPTTPRSFWKLPWQISENDEDN